MGERVREQLKSLISLWEELTGEKEEDSIPSQEN